METKIYDRKNNRFYIENTYGEKPLNFLYRTFFGRMLLNVLVSRKLFSRLNALYENSSRSAAKIEPFIQKYQIDMSQFEQRQYTSFADFFRRRVKNGARPADLCESALIAPADSKLICYQISKNLRIPVKGSYYTVSELLKNKKLAEDFGGGCCLVFRLTVDDYHHYCAVDDAKVVTVKKILGRLHTVGTISQKSHKVFTENQREYCLLKTKNFSEIIQMEVGALLVGRIVNLNKSSYCKSEEKGWFDYGGSTVILLFKKNTVIIDADILKYSAENIETKVYQGEKIGEKYV